MTFTKEQLIKRIEKQIDVTATIIERLGDDSAATSELAVKTATMDIKILDVALAALTAETVVWEVENPGEGHYFMEFQPTGYRAELVRAEYLRKPEID